jgi:hypothetical protein
MIIRAFLRFVGGQDLSLRPWWRPRTTGRAPRRGWGPRKGGSLMSAEENKKVVQRFWKVWEEEDFVDLIDE